MAETATASGAQRLEVGGKAALGALSYSQPQSDPVAVFQSVVESVLREVAAVDANVAAAVSAHTGSSSSARSSHSSSGSPYVALPLLRRRLAAVCDSAPAQPQPTRSHLPAAGTGQPPHSISAELHFPSIDRAFTLLARRLQRPFHPNITTPQAPTTTPPHPTAATQLDVQPQLPFSSSSSSSQHGTTDTVTVGGTRQQSAAERDSTNSHRSAEGQVAADEYDHSGGNTEQERSSGCLLQQQQQQQLRDEETVRELLASRWDGRRKSLGALLVWREALRQRSVANDHWRSVGVAYSVHVRELSLGRVQHSAATDWLHTQLLRHALRQWSGAHRSSMSDHATAESFHRSLLFRASLTRWSSAVARRRLQRSRYVSRVTVCLLDRMHSFRASHWRHEEGTYTLAEEWNKHRTLVTALCAWWQFIAQQSPSDALLR